jgi:hypothetical protein
MGEGSDWFGDATTLRARAERYRSLAETVSNPEIAAAALECARDLEREADLQEPTRILGAIKAA